MTDDELRDLIAAKKLADPDFKRKLEEMEMAYSQYNAIYRAVRLMVESGEDPGMIRHRLMMDIEAFSPEFRFSAEAIDQAMEDAIAGLPPYYVHIPPPLEDFP